MRIALLQIWLVITTVVFAQNEDTVSLRCIHEHLDNSAEMLFRKPDSAFVCANKAKSISIEINNKKLIAESDKYLGLYYYVRTNYDSALYYFNLAEKNLDLAKDSAQLVRIWANKGNIYAETKQFEKALETYFDVHQWFKATNDEYNMAKINATIANIYAMKNQNKEALYHYHNAKRDFKKLGKPEELSIVIQNIGLVYMQQNMLDSAFLFMHQARDFCEAEQLLLPEATCLGNLGEIHNKLGNTDSALIYLNKALKGFIKTGSKRHQAELHIQKASILETIGELQKAGTNLIKALEIVEKHQFPSLRQDIYKNLYSVSKKKRKPEQALFYHEKYTKIRDSIYEDRLKSREDSLLAMYSVTKRDREIELLKLKDNLKATLIAKQKGVLILFGAIAILMIILVFVLMNRNRIKSKANKLLNEKNEEITSQSEEISAQNEKLRQQKTEITDSIDYARFIQRAIFRTSTQQSLNFFRINQPKDIVSGDFFWYKQTEKYHYIAVADCTGHGVAGAFMSVLGFTFLNEVFNEMPNADVNQMLEKMRSKIKNALHHTPESDSSKDGLDIALIKIDKQTKELEFSGAYRPCWIFSPSGFKELKGDRQPIGYYPKEKPFTKQQHIIEPGSVIYMFTDGYPDQVSDKNGKKLTILGMKNFLHQVNRKPFEIHEQEIQAHIKSFIGDAPQIDDILISGIQID